MPNTLYSVDNDPSFRNPQAWRKTKLAFGWKPGKKTSSHLVGALLDLEQHARDNGGCVRFMLESAIRHYLSLTRDQQRRYQDTRLKEAKESGVPDQSTYRRRRE